MINVSYRYANDSTIHHIEFALESNIVTCGSNWYPGVLPLDFNHITETIAFCINDGGMLADTIEGYEEGESDIYWWVENPDMLNRDYTRILVDVIDETGDSLAEYRNQDSIRCALIECFPDDIEACKAALLDMRVTGSHITGGGAAPISRLVPVESLPLFTYPMFYIVRDTATQGCDFLLWGNDANKAVISFADATADGLAVELVAMPADKLDDHTRNLLLGAVDAGKTPTL